MSRSKILALILAGGQGGRLGVLTEARAKPAVPFAGVYRLIDFALSNCKHSQISDVWVIEQYEPHSLNDHLANGRPWDLDRTYGGLQVLPPYEERNGDEGGFAQGNADAIYRHRDYIKDFDPDILLVLSADHVYKLDFRDVIEQHEARGSDVTVVTTEVRLVEASRFGVVRANRDGRIARFDYKPETPQSRTVTTEVFVYDARILMNTLDRLSGENEQRAKREEKRSRGKSNGKANDKSNSDADGKDRSKLKDFGHELIPELVNGGNAHEFRLKGYWRDVGTIESYWLAHMELLGDPRSLKLDDVRWPILTYGTQRLPAHIHTGARIENSLISPGCDVRGHVVNSILAPGVRVERGATVRDSVVLHDAVIAARARVSNAILDEAVRVGEGAGVGKERIKRNAKSEEELRDHLTIIRRAARISAGERRLPEKQVKK